MTGVTVALAPDRSEFESKEFTIEIKNPEIQRNGFWAQLWRKNWAMIEHFAQLLSSLQTKRKQTGDPYKLEDYLKLYDYLKQNDITVYDTEHCPYANLVTKVVLTQDNRLFWILVRQSIKLGKSTTYGNTGIKDIENGPLALFQLSENIISIAVHIDSEWTKQHPERRKRFYDFLDTLGTTFEVWVFCPEMRTAQEINDKISSSSLCVNETTHPIRDETLSNKERLLTLYTYEPKISKGGPYYEVLAQLVESDDQCLPYQQLQEEFNVSRSAVRKRVRKLLDIGVIEKFPRSGENWIGLSDSAQLTLDEVQ